MSGSSSSCNSQPELKLAKMKLSQTHDPKAPAVPATPTPYSPMEAIVVAAICPISKKAFRNPVTLASGHTVEMLCLHKWFKHRKNQPFTGAPVTPQMRELRVNRAMQNMVDHLEYARELEKRNVPRFAAYDPAFLNVDFFESEETFCVSFLTMPPKRQKECLSVVDLEVVNAAQVRPIHLLCAHATFDVFCHFMELLSNDSAHLNSPRADGLRPIHCARKRARPEPRIVGYLLAAGAVDAAAPNSYNSHSRE